MSTFDAVFNLGLKATRRLQSAHKPLVRLMRRNARAQEHQGYRQDADDIDRQIAACAAGSRPIVVGPWLSEVGYEVLYWIPFLRWFQDAFGVAPQRLVVVSRGGMEPAYRELAGRYVDLLDLTTPERLATRNTERRSDEEDGGQKQSGVSQYDEEIVGIVRARLGIGDGAVLHPSLMFRLFRHVWYDNLPFDVLWRHTRYRAQDRSSLARLPLPQVDVALPAEFVAVKVYGGPAIGTSETTRRLVRDVVRRAATVAPVVVLENDHGLDEHRDFDFEGLPGVTSAKALMTPRTNLGVQLALVARARFFLSACGGLAWLAPFLGVPTVALYENDRLLAPHLFVARHAGARVGAAEFTPLDLRAIDRLALSAPLPR